MRQRNLLLLASLTCLLVPGTAVAHGVGGGNGSESIPRFVWLGIRHMVGGWDHLLFILGIVLIAGGLRASAKLISLFVLGHSTTLLLASAMGWQLNPEAVDVLIALSVAFVGYRVLSGRPADIRLTALIIFAFGLVHGLGLSTRLQELDLPAGFALVARVLAFNLGVEIGQLLALTALVGVGLLLRRRLPQLSSTRTAVAGSLVAFGLLAAAAFSFLALRPGETAADAAARAGCVETDFSPDLSEGRFGAHPEQTFFEPGQATKVANLQHVMGDGFIILVYRPSLDEKQRADLREWVEKGQLTIAVPGKPEMQRTFEAATRQTSISCNSYSMEALDDFRTRWLTGG
jgi:hydrogenase/urease accessory protein HupE